MIKKKTKQLTAKIQNELQLNKTVLNTGLTIVTEQSPHSPSFALGFCIKSGSAHDKTGYEGTAHFMEHVAFRRTRTYTGRRLVTEFESIGSYINAFTTKETTCFYVLALNKNLKKCLNLLSEVVFHPNIKPSDIAKEKGIILEEISSYEDDPEELIFDYAEKSLFKGSSYEHQITGSDESVERIETQQLIQFHETNYIPSNIILSYSGPEPHDYITELIEKLNLNFHKNNQPTNLIVPTIRKPEIIEIAKQFQQNHLLYVIRTNGMSCEERYSYAVISNILGEGLSSRLNQLLREKHGYVYTVYTSLSLLKSFGTLGIYAAADGRNKNKVETLIKKELQQISESGFTDKELKSAKEQIKSSTIMALEGVSSKMQSLARLEAAEAMYESISDTINLVDSVTSDEVLNLVQKNLTPEKWSEVIFTNKK